MEKKMSKLTDTQLVLLCTAAQRGDGAAAAPDRWNKAAKAKVAASLIARKLMRIVRAKPGMPVWSDNSDGKRSSLIITRAGRDATGVVDESAEVPTRTLEKVVATRATAEPDVCGYTLASAQKPGDDGIPSAQNAPTPDQPRAGTKSAQLVELLSKPDGTTLHALVRTFGWLPHTTRAALTGLRKRGFAITRTTRADKPSIYAIVTPVIVKAAMRQRA